MIPDIRYAKTPQGVHIAYHVSGDGPMDLVMVSPAYSNIDGMWRDPAIARFLTRIGSITRLINFDPRGFGLSDRVVEGDLPTLESRMSDALSVMDSVGCERAALFAMDSTGPLAILFAATYPERTTALVVYGSEAAGSWSSDYPWGWTDEHWDEFNLEVENGWGQPDYFKDYWKWMAPTVRLDQARLEVLTSGFRSTSPGAAVAQNRMEQETDVRRVLSAVHVPTLILHRRDEQAYSVEEGRYLAEHVQGARFVELVGPDHPPWEGDSSAVVSEIERFLQSVRDDEAELDRVLATVLFTDIVGSTRTAAELGDRAWRDLLQRHHATVRAMLGRYRGTEIETTGDGFLATFDGPVRGVRCAKSIIESVQPLGLEVRAGLHTGEVETIEGKVAGIAVHIGERVGALAGSSEIMVSQTVKDLVAGSGLVFEDAGEHDLKGVPDSWRLYRVVD